MGILDDYKKDMVDEVRKKSKKNVRWLKFKIWFIRRRWWILGISIALILLLFPVQSGTAIGTWISKFIGSIVNSINF